MVFKIQNDYGTLQCSFNELCVWFCDNPSCGLMEDLEKRFRSLYGEGFKLDFVIIDPDKMDVKIYRLGTESILPFQSVSYPYFFRKYPECDLLKFVNVFSRKRLTFINGRATFIPNRNYLRLNLHNS